ncbi:hypothetical protein M2347_001568 [Chryseobacterium sp. H1D6B]|uniref:hypothetical protein n=1 Tax=Chryseobacterium sp. H1D6B TaxID=2940588 RepID=UPI0015CCE20F|nr:hypothetical protein [Chryseobacterium sp. H1D6B]MDH6251841.1 hypothetical protein [Chryseobacterium sp. H1D6B]
MKNIFLGLIGISLFTVSCKKDERPTYIKEEAGVQSPSAAVNSAPQTSLMSQPGMQPIQNTATAITAPGMNPPHGDPGHRCDIPVGQPLNNQPAQASPAINTPSTAIQIDPNSVSPGKIMIDNNGKQVKTAPGMNPPHGEPGHRCDIQVGQPLNSKPAPQPAANTAQTAPVPAPAPAEQNLASGEKPKLNPAHGEPFHLCSLKVGDPLP